MVNVIRQMASLFSKVDSNKLWPDVQNEDTVIYAQFGKDLFNIFKVIGRKTKWPRLFGVYSVHKAINEMVLTLCMTMSSVDTCSPAGTTNLSRPTLSAVSALSQFCFNLYFGVKTLN